MARDTNWEKLALRRAEFLLQEALSEQPTKDQTVTFALRVISNWATVGKDASSGAIKWLNPRVSEAAWKLFDDVSDREWESQTINEHQEPISIVWEWIVENKKSITANDILDRSKKWPMITITKAEDSALNKNGFRAGGQPLIRHSSISLGRRGPPQRRTRPKTGG